MLVTVAGGPTCLRGREEGDHIIDLGDLGVDGRPCELTGDGRGHRGGRRQHRRRRGEAVLIAEYFYKDRKEETVIYYITDFLLKSVSHK